MQSSVEAAAAAAVVIPLHPPRARPLAEGLVVPLADQVSAIVFDDSSTPAGRARLRVELDGAPLGQRMISTTLKLRAGGNRHLLLVGLPAARIARSRVALAVGREFVAAIDPEWLQSPLADSGALIEGLSDQGRRRLLRLFLTTGSSLFRLDAADEFGAAVSRLLDLLGLRALTPASWCPVGAGGQLFTYRVPTTLDTAGIGSLVALAGGRIRRLTGCQLRTERGERGGLLHIFLPRAVPAGTTLFGFGEAPVQLRTPDAKTAPRAIAPWLARRAESTRAWARGLVEAGAPADPLAAAQLREIIHADAPTRLTIRHLSATPAGLLYALAVEDPHNLLRAVRIERNGQARDVALPPAARPVRDLSGFVGFARPPVGGDRARLRLIFGSGRVQTIREGKLSAYRGDLPAGFDTREPAVAAALAEARLSIEWPASITDCLVLGVPPEQPTLSLIAPVDEDLDLIRARAAMIFAEPGSGDVEVVCHVPASRLADAARIAIADAVAVYGIGHRLVIVPPGADRGEGLRAALSHARGSAMLLLGAGVLPAGPGWLTPWRCRLVAARPVLGGTLLDTSGAVIDAGGSDRDDRRHVGLPATDLPGVPALATARVSAECVGVTRAVAEALCESSTRYPNPDVLLGEIVAGLGEGKEAATMLRARFVRYGEARPDRRAECVDSEALQLVLKRSFSPSGQEDRP